MSAVCTVLDVARSNIAKRIAGRSRKPLGRPPQPDDELVAAIKAVIADMPTYGYPWPAGDCLQSLKGGGSTPSSAARLGSPGSRCPTTSASTG